MSYDDKGFKWLFLRNWKRYQPDNRLRNKEARLKYVLNWIDKLDNYDYQRLTMFERALFDGLILLAGSRPYRSIPNDATWIARALHVTRTEIARVQHALVTLIEQGYVIPTNTEKNFEEDGENTVGTRTGTGERTGTFQSVHQSVNEEADASQKDDEEPEVFVVVDLDTAVHDLPCFTLLHEEFGREAELPEVTVRRVHSALKALGKNEAWMQGCIQYTQRHRWWKERNTHAEAFAKALIKGINDPEGKKLPAQYDKHVAQRRRAAGAGKR